MRGIVSFLLHMSIIDFFVAGPGGVTALPNIAYGSVFMKLWSGLTALDNDPHPGVASLARTVTDYIRDQVSAWVASNGCVLIYPKLAFVSGSICDHSCFSLTD